MGKREENKRRKHDALLAAGLQAFQEEGYERASIETIVKLAGVARGTFYLYFDDKLLLFQALLAPWFDALLQMVVEIDDQISGVDDTAQLQSLYEDMAMRIALLGLEHHAVILLAFRELRSATEAGAHLREREAAILDGVTAMTAHAAERGLIRVQHPGVVARVVLGSVERLTFDVLTGTELGPPLEVAEEVVSLFSRALLEQTSGGQDPNGG